MKKLQDWFQNLSLKNKLTLIILEMTLFLIFIGLIGFYVTYRENQSLNLQYQNRLLSIKWLNTIWANVRENEATLYKIIIIPDPIVKKRLFKDAQNLGHLWLLKLNNYKITALHDPYEETIMPELEQKALKYISIRDQALQLALEGKKQEFLNLYISNLRVLDNFTDSLKDLSEYNDKMAEKEYKIAIKQSQASYILVFSSIFLALAIAIFFAWLIISNITNSIQILVDKMKQVASGNLDIEPIEIKYNDEIGKLSESFNTMTDNLRRLILKEKIAREKEDYLRKEIEEQRRTFLSTLTHDLRSPLIAEQKAIEAILSGNIGQSLNDFSEYLQDMHKTNENLLAIVNNLLIADYYETETIELELESHNIKDIVAVATKSMIPLAKDNQSEIITDIGPSLPPVKINATEINRVFINLIGNAIKHNKKGTTIKISAKSKDNTVLVSISDNGKGIPESEKPNIFRKYPSTKRKIGSGLGLYLSKQIINAHNGRIWFETEEGKGTTFYFILPT